MGGVLWLSVALEWTAVPTPRCARGGGGASGGG